MIENTTNNTIDEIEQMLEQEGHIQSHNQELLRTEWLQEAKQIPLDTCTTQEQQLLLKCINQEHMTTEEINTLQTILNRYRPAIRKHKPQQTIQNAEQNIEYVQNEQQFLELLETYDQPETITMYYPLPNNKELKLELEILPITDSKTIQDIQTHLQLFQDYTPQEIQTYQKHKTQNTPITKEEQNIINKINKDLETKVNTNQIEIAIEFLSYQTKFKNTPHNPETMKKMYQKMDITYLGALFTKVQTKTGIGDINIDHIFRNTD